MSDDDVAVFGGYSTVKKEEEAPPEPKADPVLTTFENVETMKEEIPLWEERWSPEWLRKQREEAMGSREFDRGYRQYAISDEELTWQKEWIEQCIDKNFCAEDYISNNSRWKPYVKHAGVDLAIVAEEKAGSFFVIVVIAIDEGGHKWVLWIERARGLTFGQQAEACVDIANRFRVNMMAVESVGYQQILTRELETFTDVPVEPFHTEAKHKLDTIIGIPSLAAEFEHKRWHLPYGDAFSKRMTDPFVDEMTMHPLPGHNDDIVMAAYFARESYRGQRLARPRLSVIRF